MNSLITSSLFIGEIIVIYYLSHHLLNVWYSLLRKFIRSNSLIIWIISILYLPGTIIHEISHYFFALLLAMYPEEVSIFPQIEKNHIQLGHVLYRKHPSDFIRPFIVGIAPFFGAIGLLLIIQSFQLFPGSIWWQTILFGYLILTITANMFSSKQDLVDLVYIIPLFLIVVAIIYIFQIQLSPLVSIQILNTFGTIFSSLQIPLLFSIVVHGILIVVIKIILSVL